MQTRVHATGLRGDYARLSAAALQERVAPGAGDSRPSEAVPADAAGQTASPTQFARPAVGKGAWLRCLRSSCIGSESECAG